MLFCAKIIDFGPNIELSITDFGHAAKLETHYLALKYEVS